MKELWEWAKSGNADQVFAVIDENFKEDKVLTQLIRGYENGYLSDSELCEWVARVIELWNVADEVE